MPYYFKTLQRDGFIFPDAALPAGDIHLLVHGVHTVQVRQQEAAPGTAADDDAVTADIQLFLAADSFRSGKNVHVDLQPFQFLRPDGIKPGIPGGSADGVADDLLRNVFPGRQEGADTAPELILTTN